VFETLFASDPGRVQDPINPACSIFTDYRIHLYMLGDLYKAGGQR
jgi:hypothetical protein